MSPLLVLFLRRLAVVALLVTVLLLVLPRLLTEVGILGPTAEELMASAASAVEAARSYGATEELPSFVAAQKDLLAARSLLQEGRQREARKAARLTTEKAVLAQRDGLIHLDQSRRRADAIVKEVDRRLIELEALYSRVSKVVDKTRLRELLSLMKGARQAGAGLVLAFEQDDFARVIAGEATAFATLDAVREELRKAVSPD